MEHRSRRNFSEPPARKGLADRDAAEGVTRLRAATHGVYGGVLGGLLGYFLVERGAPPWVAPLCLVSGWALVSLGTLLMVSAAGSAASTLYTPSSGAPPRKAEHSRAESLVARGMYQEAVDAFELAVSEDPSDPSPYLRIARVYRDHMGRPEDAARWFRRALREAGLQPGPAFVVRRELVELFTHRMGSPERALPELARMAEELAGTPDGEWAAAELRAIKERLTRDG